MTEKPPVLSDERLLRAPIELSPDLDGVEWHTIAARAIAEAQRDTDVEHYEPLIEKLEGEVKAFSELADSYHKHLKQAHQDTAREFMKTIETMYPELRQVYWQGKGWQSLKEKYGVSKEVK